MVNLTKDAPKISLEKESVNIGEMRVNLNWSQPEQKKGFWASLAVPKVLDLDLGCLFELENGEKGVVQALGNSFGSLKEAPYMKLDQDDRTGQSSEGENLFLNMSRISNIKRMLIFAFIYEGAPSWDTAKGLVTIYPPQSEQIVVRLDAPQLKRMCAIASVKVDNGDVSIQREIKYFQGHSDMDAAFGWGLTWTPGTKD